MCIADTDHGTLLNHHFMLLMSRNPHVFILYLFAVNLNLAVIQVICYYNCLSDVLPVNTEMGEGIIPLLGLSDS